VGVGLADDDVLAAHEDGTPIRPEHLAREWTRLCQRAGVPDLGTHAARHAHVGILLAAGLPDRIAARLGHTEQVMRDTNGVPFVTEQDTAAEVMAALYRRSSA
jgi:integrase